MAAALMAGCATNPAETVLAPVSPDAGQPAAEGTGTGSLIVYSAYDVNPDFNARDNYGQIYTDYTILTDAGRKLEQVRNNSGTLWQKPVRVSLPAGQYRVAAHANGSGEVTVPVIIAAGQLTTVRLQGDVSLGR